jgi:DNA-binding transcriptional LysR family regulator
MELHQLRYVLAVAETGSFSRAARSLFVVQSNVSAQVRKLESELGVELFERRAHEVVLTDFGRAFVPRVRQTLADLEAARSAIDAVRGLVSGRAALGVPGTVVGWLLPDVIRQFRQRYPGVDLWITEEASVVLAGMVASRDLPQAVVNLPVAAAYADLLVIEALFDEDLAAVVPVSHALYGTAAVPLASLQGEDLLLPEVGNPLRKLILDACAGLGFSPSPAIEFGKKQLTREMALAGIGIGIVPMMTARHDLAHDSGRIVRIEAPRLVRSVGMVRHRAARLSPADRALRDVICEQLGHFRAEGISLLQLASSTSKH